MPVHSDDPEDYKVKYRALKRKLRILIYENECFQEELSLANKALLRVKQDKSFLLDQLAPYHQNPASSSDSDLTDCSDSEVLGPIVKRKRAVGDGLSSGNSSQVSNSSNSQQPKQSSSSSNNRHQSVAKGNVPSEGSSKQSAAKKRPATSTANRSSKAVMSKNNSSKSKRTPPKDVQNNALMDNQDRGVKVELTREEIERKLAALNTDKYFTIPVSENMPNNLFSDSFKEEMPMDEDFLTTDGGEMMQ